MIELPDAPVELIAQALFNRGITHGQQGDIKKELSDFTRVIELPDAPVELVAKALLRRGTTYFNEQQEFEKSLNDFKTIINYKELKGTSYLINAHMFSAEVYMSLNKWKDAKQSMLNGLMIEEKSQEAVDYNTSYIIKVIYEKSIDTNQRNIRATELVNLFFKNQNALTELGVSLIDHLGALYKRDSKPLQDNLDSWLKAWEMAMKDIDELSVTLRLFTTGIAFLKSEKNDEQILLDLIDSERKILRQTFDLD